MLDKMIACARWILGIQLLLSGLNWYLGFYPMPNMLNLGTVPIKHAVVAEMINTGWMFQTAKAIEILAGALLLANRFVPLALALAAPITVITFMLDAFIVDDVIAYFNGATGWRTLASRILDMIFGGACVLLPQIYLMIAYLESYRPMLAPRVQARHP